MSEEEGSKGMVQGTIEAATGLVKAVPIYQDMFQPAAKQLGKSLETVCKAVNVALSPVSGLVWGYEQFQAFIDTKVADRLKDVPPEDIITPKANVAGPAIEALRYTGHEESLSDMYANLLATAMDKNKADGAHPAFVEIIKQLTPDEAKLMAYFLTTDALPLLNIRADLLDGTGGVDLAKHVSLFDQHVVLDVPAAVPSYLNNMCRLGLLDIPETFRFLDEEIYTPLEESPTVKSLKEYIDSIPDRNYRAKRSGLVVTSLGALFGAVCVTGGHARK